MLLILLLVGLYKLNSIEYDLKWLRKKLSRAGVGVGVVGLAENIANSAQLELELGKN